MITSTNEKVDHSGNMIRTLLVIFLGIVAKDACTGNLKWNWTILMAGIVACLSLFKAIVALTQKKVAANNYRTQFDPPEHG